MQYRAFGATGLRVSERGFGAWAIGGTSYGRIDPQQALDALAQAEDLGCNIVDTAAVYGDSEALLGRFLSGRRDRWILASKYSAQPAGMTALVEDQLRRLRTDRIDFYQLHWVPRDDRNDLYEELERLKQQGKIRFAGVSLYTADDIDYVLDRTQVDGFQVRFSLLDPDPFLTRLERIRQRRPAVIVRSALAEGFLTGKYQKGATFPDTADQRQQWPGGRIRRVSRQAEAFRFLAEEAPSMLAGAIAYPLSFAEVSTVVVGCKTQAQAAANFGGGIPSTLSPELRRRIERTQRALGVNPAHRAVRLWRRLWTWRA
jgi:aryl-alcohol dehydrogenase-like predicted oxidoreductase